jgi:hypothetical protein
MKLGGSLTRIKSSSVLRLDVAGLVMDFVSGGETTKRGLAMPPTVASSISLQNFCSRQQKGSLFSPDAIEAGRLKQIYVPRGE